MFKDKILLPFLRHDEKRHDTFALYVIDSCTNPSASGISMSASYTVEIILKLAAQSVVARKRRLYGFCLA
jgi:hypothetical protein